LVYDTSDASFRSTGKIGVCFVGDQAIHKKVDGWLEMGLLPGKDYFNLYFKMGTGEWFYFEYKFNTLTVLSSYDDFNGLITVVPQDKRVVKTDKDAYYVYGPASSADKQLFTDAMKARAAGTAVESRRERYSTPPARPGARIPGMPSAVPIPVEPGYNPEPAVDQIPTDGAVPADSGSAEPQPVVPAEPPRRESSRDRIYRQKAAEQGGGGASDSAPVEQNAAPSEVPATPVQTPPAESQPPVTTPEGNANPDPVQPPATPVQTPPTESQPPVTTPEGNANPDPVQPPVAPVKTPPAESQPPAAPPVTSPEGNSSPATPESSQGTEQQSNDSASQSPAGDDNSGSGKRKKGKGKNQDSAPE
jgi:hypothetical protein